LAFRPVKIILNLALKIQIVRVTESYTCNVLGPYTAAAAADDDDAAPTVVIMPDLRRERHYEMMGDVSLSVCLSHTAT